MTYSFTLQVAGIDLRSESFEDALFEAGCSDALVNVVNGTVFLDFDRDAASYAEAVRTAKQDVEKAGGKAIETIRLPD